MPAGRIDPLFALALGVLLGVSGITYLTLAVNPLTALLGTATLGSYVFVYTPMERWTTLCTIVGAIPGAIPPVMGWTAMTNSLSVEAGALFAILFIWQHTHFCRSPGYSRTTTKQPVSKCCLYSKIVMRKLLA